MPIVPDQPHQPVLFHRRGFREPSYGMGTAATEEAAQKMSRWFISVTTKIFTFYIISKVLRLLYELLPNEPLLLRVRRLGLTSSLPR